MVRSSSPWDSEIRNSEGLGIVHLEDLTQEDLDQLDVFLDIPPAEKGSGLSDVSINHDKYLYGDTPWGA